jgi:hypothetical protein
MSFTTARSQPWAAPGRTPTYIGSNLTGVSYKSAFLERTACKNFPLQSGPGGTHPWGLTRMFQHAWRAHACAHIYTIALHATIIFSTLYSQWRS